MCLSDVSLFSLHLSGPSSAGWAGKEFALSFMQNYAPHYSIHQLKLYITAVQANTKITVEVAPLNFKEVKVLKAGEGVTINLPNGVEMYSSIRSPNTVHIKASADVSVSSFSYMSYSADTSVIYPITEWGTEYFILTPPGSGSPFLFKEFSVTNGKDSNTVEIFPQGPIYFEHRLYLTGSKMTIDLKPYESVQLQSTHDLSSSRVSSKHPVAVFTGHSCAWHLSKCDHVYEQLLPTSSWGKSFIVPPLSFQKKYDTVYVQTSQPTKVTVHQGNQKYEFQLQGGQLKKINYINPETLFIQSDHGIQVLLFFNGVQMGWFTYYDPFLMTIVSTDRFCSSYSLQVPSDFKDKALIVAQTSAIKNLLFDGKIIPKYAQWKNIAGTDFSWTEMSYKQTGSNIHTVSSSGSSFGLYSIGLGHKISYGAPGQCTEKGKKTHIKTHHTISH